MEERGEGVGVVREREGENKIKRVSEVREVSL